MKKLVLLTLTLLTCASLSSAVAQSNSNNRQCIRSANTTFLTCSRECKNGLDDSLLICSAKGNTTLADCFKGCDSDKDACLKPFQDTLRTCSDGCFATADTALSACETTDCKVDTRSCNLCKLTAKLSRLTCADACLDTFESSKAIRAACRSTFRSCLKTCRAANK
jgi:hypothetical protein